MMTNIDSKLSQNYCCVFYFHLCMNSLGVLLGTVDTLVTDDEFIAKALNILAEHLAEYTQAFDLDGVTNEMVLGSIKTSVTTVTK